MATGSQILSPHPAHAPWLRDTVRPFPLRTSDAALCHTRLPCLHSTHSGTHDEASTIPPIKAFAVSCKAIPCAFPQQQLLAESSFPFFLLLVQTRDSAQFASIRTSMLQYVIHAYHPYNEATRQFRPCHHSLLSTGNACPSQLHTADDAPCYTRLPRLSKSTQARLQSEDLS